MDKKIKNKNVDLGGLDFPSVLHSSEIYDALRETFGFPIELKNFKVNGRKHDSVIVNPVIEENKVTIIMSDATLIATEDEVKVFEGFTSKKLEVNGMSLTPHYYDDVLSVYISERNTITSQTTIIIGNLAYIHAHGKTLQALSSGASVAIINTSILPLSDIHKHAVFGEIYASEDGSDVFDMNFSIVYSAGGLPLIAPTTSIPQDRYFDLWFVIALENAPEVASQIDSSVTLSIPSTATNGTLTDEEFHEVTTSTHTEIVIGTARYAFEENHSDEGYLTYKDYESNKLLTLNINNKSFTIN